MKKLLNFTAVCLFCLFSIQATYGQGLNYYWVGGGGDWGDLSHWASSSGGLGSAYGYPPSPLDNVIFDHNSGFTATSNIVTTPSYSGITVNNMIWSNAPNNPTFDENPTTDFVVLGNITLQQSMTFRAQILMMGDKDATITSNGAKIGGNLYIDKENASVALVDSLMLYYVSHTNARSGSIILSRGTLDCAGNNLYANSFIMYGNNACHIDFENAQLFFKSPLVGAYDVSSNYYNTAGSLVSHNSSFRIEGNYKTLNATNSKINFQRVSDGMMILNNAQYTFNEVEYYNSTYHYGHVSGASNFGSAIIKKIKLDNTSYQAFYFSTGAVVDSIFHGDINGFLPNYHWGSKVITAERTKFKFIQFDGFIPFNWSNQSYYEYRTSNGQSTNYNSIPLYINLSNCQVDSIKFNVEHAQYSNNIAQIDLNNTTTVNSITSKTSALYNIINTSHVKNIYVNGNLHGTQTGNSIIDSLFIGQSGNVTVTGSNLKDVYFTKESEIKGQNGTVGSAFFNEIGRVNSTNSTFRFLEYNINGWLEGNNNIFDTLVFSPGYTYRFGNGVSNTIRKRWYASGNPCYFTEVYNVGSSGTATVNLHAGVPNEFDYIRFWGVRATAAAPIYAGVRSINVANNSFITFAPYNALELLYPFGTDQEVRCHTDYPFTLNTDGFYGNTNTQYTWQDGSQLDSFVVNGPGVYRAQAYYGRNCYYTASYTVLDQLSASVNAIDSISCDPANPTGSLTAIAGGHGGGSYTYEWNLAPVAGPSALSTNQTIEDIHAGQYQVTITDDLNCAATAIGTISGSDNKLSLSHDVYPDCDASTLVGTGHIQVHVTGGTAPYTYKWSPLSSVTTSFADNLEAGTYHVVVTDALGCKSDTLTITVGTGSSSLSTSVSVTQPVNCELVGSATVSVVGTGNSFSYVWSHDNTITSNSANNIPVGTNYVLTVDVNNCADQQTVTIISPDVEYPIFNYCPDSITVYTTGSCGQVVTWVEPTIADINENCSISSITSSHQSGDVFPIGTTSVSYTVTDVFGNSKVCKFSVTVEDKEKPTFVNCIQDIVIQANTGNCTATATWPTPVVLDNCSVASITSDFASGSTFPIGITTVTYTAVDAYGNAENCIFKVIVKAHPNDFKLTSACPVNQVIGNDADLCKATYQLPQITYTSTCSTPWYVTGPNLYTPNTVHEFAIGQYVINYKLTNGSDTLSCSFNLEVKDNQRPTLAPGTTYSSYNYVYPNDCNGYTVIPKTLNWVDNCGIDSVWTEPANSTTLGIGQGLHVYYYARDIYGNENYVSEYYYVQPVSNVIIEDCPSTITTTENTCGGAVVSWTVPQLEFACVTVTSTHNPGDLFPVGTTTVTITYSNPQGVIGTCSFNVVVQPSQNSVSECPSDISHVLSGNECSKVVTWDDPQFNSYCTVVSTSSNYPSGHAFPLGVTPVIITATLSDGSTLTCSFNVTISNPNGSTTVVNDCPNLSGLNFYVDPLVDCENAAVNFTEPTFVSGLCSNPVDHVTMSPNGFNQNDMLELGSHAFSYTAYDVNNVVLATCDFTVNVLDTVSQLSIECPGVYSNGNRFLYIELDPTTCSEVANWNLPTFNTSGACIGAFGYLNQNYGITPGTVIDVNSHNLWISYSGYDVNNQLIGECSFQIVPFFHDSLFSNNVDTTIYTNSITCTAPFSWDVPTSNINCAQINVQIQNNSSNWINGLDPGNNAQVQNFGIGVYTIQYNLYSGNTQHLVNYTINVLDGSTPTFGNTCPSDTVELYTSFNTCEAVANWATPVAIGGSCATAQFIPLTTNVASGTVLPIGDTVVVYTTLNNGSVANCTFVATVIDTITPSIYVCPSNIVVPTTSDCEGIATWNAPSVFDNCSGVTSTSDLPSGHSFPIGTTTVTYTVSDASNNSAYCSFTVTVVDTIAPQIVNCPSDITVNSTVNTCGGVATWIAPTAIDNCTTATLLSNYEPGDVLPMGTTTVHYTAVDLANNTSTCSFNVVVFDVHAPSLMNCPSDITINSLHNVCARNVMWNAPTANDPCNNSVISSTHESGDLFEVGVTTVTYYIVDQSGNIDSCSFNVTVTDISAPQITACPPNQELELSFGQCVVPATWTTPIAIDNCSNVSLMSTHVSGDQFPIGTTVVTYTATDAQGLQDVCSFRITVIDPNNFCGGSVAPGKDVVVPDAFTPDGDGVNDVLVIEGIEHYPNNEFVIFNRWGTEVYRFTGYSNQWDGKINVGTGLEGSELPTGTYFYILDTKDKVLGVLKGYIYLQR